MSEVNDENLITLIDEEGNETLYEILFTFHSDDYNRSYVLLVPAETNDNEEVIVEAYAYTEQEDSDDFGELEEIESDEEWDMVEEVLGTYLADENLND
ncbi:MAG: DUF1292 domain-containing protein [Aerococcus sp.]|nr:DUF1292 domain-containing protein [Aerococcus sp.]